MYRSPYGKRPTALLPSLIQRLQGCTSRADIREVLTSHRYVGNLKAAAERYGASYLKTKKMRRREMEEWIINNHPAVKKEGDSGVRG